MNTIGMLARLLGIVLIAGISAVSGALLLAEPVQEFLKGKKPPPPDRAAKELRHTYQDLAEVAVWVNSKSIRLPEEVDGLFAEAKELYKSAHRAISEDEGPAAAERVLAAKDAARGLKHVLHGLTPALRDLPAPPEDLGPPEPPPPPDKKKPAPPPGPEGKKPPPPPPPKDGPHGKPKPHSKHKPHEAPADKARKTLTKVRERLQDSEVGSLKEAAAFVKASRAVYELARQAYQDEQYKKAEELAKGAEAWTHVSEHLARAEGDEPAPPRKERPAVRQRNVPPPPPPLDQEAQLQPENLPAAEPLTADDREPSQPKEAARQPLPARMPPAGERLD